MPRFVVGTAYLPTDQLAPIAVEADRCGFYGLSIADHVLHVESIESVHPFSPDGVRSWPPFTHWPDPFVAIGHLSALTDQLRFLTGVYVASLRSPVVLAKAVGTAAALSNGRVELGVGSGWCREEFDAVGVPFDERGGRTDEILEILDASCRGGWFEHHGPYFDIPRSEITPAAPAPVPVLVGGDSAAALARAARRDGWFGGLLTIAEAGSRAAQLRRLRAQAGESRRPLRVVCSLRDARDLSGFRNAAAAGVTDVVTMPWAYDTTIHAPLADKLEGIRRFAGRFLDADSPVEKPALRPGS